MSRIASLLRGKGTRNLGENDRIKSGLVEKATKAWGTLRETLVDPTYVSAVKPKKGLDEKNKHVLTHGMHRDCNIYDGVYVVDGLHNPVTDEFIILDELRMLSIYKTNGQLRGSIVLEDQLKALVCIIDDHEYVGWDGNSTLITYSANFEVLSRYQSDIPISMLKYSKPRLEVISIGKGNMTCWNLRYNNRHLLPRLSVTDPTGEQFSTVEFNMLALEESASKKQRAYAISGTSCYVFNIYYGKFLEVKKSLHVRSISSVMYFNPVKCLVTGSVDGSIKMWDSDWRIKMIFIGHTNAVTRVYVYPFGPYLISASLDSTMRVWSLETCDEVEVIPTESPVDILITNSSLNKILTTQHQRAYIYSVDDLYTLFTTVGEPVTKIAHTIHPLFNQKTFCICDDSSIRILSSTNGQVLNSLLLNEGERIRDVVYAVSQQAIFCLMRREQIVKGSMKTNPGVITRRWSNHALTGHEGMQCIALYEHVSAKELLNREDAEPKNQWEAILKAAGTKELAKALEEDEETDEDKTNQLKKLKAIKSEDPLLLLIGKRDGCVASIDTKTGKVDYEIQAHEMSSVTCILAHEDHEQILTAGTDKVVKIWKVFPYSKDEKLSGMMTFFFPSSPTHLLAFRTKFFVAFQDPETASYSCTVYNIQERTRFDHNIEDDHTDSIVGVASCPKMKLFATVSEDETVKIWSDHCRLIKTIHLNAVPWSIDFCNERGDLLLGIGDHIYRIDHLKYFTKNLMYKQFSMSFKDPQPEQPEPYDDEILLNMGISDIKRLKAVHDSKYNFKEYQEILPDEEWKEIQEERQEKKQRYKDLQSRDHELEKIREGDLTNIGYPREEPSDRVKQAAFRQYMSMFAKKVEVNLPKDDDIFQPTPEPETGVSLKFKEDKDPVGFFPKMNSEYIKGKQMDFPQSGYLPNSILLKLLYPEDQITEMKKQFEVPKLTQEQIEEIERRQREKARLKKLRQEDQAAMDELLELEQNAEPVGTSSLMEKLQKAAKTPTPPPSPEIPKDEVEAAEREERLKDIKELQEKAPKPILKSNKPIKKFISRPPKTPPVAPPKEVKPVVLFQEEKPRPVTPRPVTPLPDYITRYRETDWFMKFFPQLNERTFPKPWLVENFATMLLRQTKVCDLNYKSFVTEALQELYEEFKLDSLADEIVEGLLFVLEKSDPPTVQTLHGRAFIQSCCVFFGKINKTTQNIIVEMMAMYLEKDNTTKQVVHETFRKLGVVDPQKFFYKEMDTWELPEDNDLSFKRQLLTMSEQWLHQQMEACKEHVEYTIEELRSGRMVVAGAVGKKFRSKEKKPALADAPEPGKAITVVLERIPEGIVDTITPLEAINYFTDCRLAEYFDSIRGAERDLEAGMASRKTVIVLPKISADSNLIRLGEMHTTNLREGRTADRSRMVAGPPPAVRRKDRLKPLTHVNLPMKPVYMNPFGDELDELLLELEKQPPLLIMLKTEQKYFFPEHSIVIK